MMSDSFTSFLHCKGTAIIPFCKKNRQKKCNYPTFVDLCQDCDTILTHFNTIFADTEALQFILPRS